MKLTTDQKKLDLISRLLEEKKIDFNEALLLSTESEALLDFPPYPYQPTPPWNIPYPNQPYKITYTDRTTIS